MSDNRRTWDNTEWDTHPFYKLIGIALRDLGIIGEYPFLYSNIYLDTLSPSQARHNEILKVMGNISHEMNGGRHIK